MRYALFVYSSSSSSSSSRYRIGPSESESLVWLSLGLSGITVTWACSVFTLGRCGFSVGPSAELLENKQIEGILGLVTVCSNERNELK